ncbi:MAG: hypothetical protein V9G21_03140 [Methylotenera sp.]
MYKILISIVILFVSVYNQTCIANDEGKCSKITSLTGKYTTDTGKVFELNFDEQRINIGSGILPMSSCWYESPQPCCYTDVATIHIQVELPIEMGGNSMLDIDTDSQNSSKNNEFAYSNSTNKASQTKRSFNYTISSLSNNKVIESGKLNYSEKLKILSLYDQYVGANLADSGPEQVLVPAGKCKLYSKIQPVGKVVWKGGCAKGFANGGGITRYYSANSKLFAIGKDNYQNGQYQSTKDAYFLNEGKIMKMSKDPVNQPAQAVSADEVPIWARELARGVAGSPAASKLESTPQDGGSFGGSQQ